MKDVMIYQKDVTQFPYDKTATGLVLSRKMTPDYADAVTLYASKTGQLFQVSTTMPPLKEDMAVKSHNIYREPTYFLQLLEHLKTEQENITAIVFRFDDEFVSEYDGAYVERLTVSSVYTEYANQINAVISALTDEAFMLNNLRAIDILFKHLPIRASYYASSVVSIRISGKPNPTDVTHEKLINLTVPLIDPTLTFRPVRIQTLGKVAHPLAALGDVLTYLDATPLPEPAKTAYRNASDALHKLAKKHKGERIYTN